MGPGLGANDAMSASRSVHLVEYSPICVPPVSVSPSEPQPPTASLGDSARPAGRSGPVSYQDIAYALGPSASEILCVPFKCEVSIPPVLWGF